MFLHEEAEKVSEWFNEWDFDPLVVMPVFMIVFLLIADAVDPEALSAGLAALVLFSPLWLPCVLFVMFWRRWIHYIRFVSWFRTQMVLLHIELPPEIEKSPLAMEVVLATLHNAGGEYSFIGRFWDGKMRGVSSLELTGNSGRVGYYVHLRKGWKNTFEARLYGQYPEARVTEVEDYVPEAQYSPATHSLWGCEFKKSAPDAMPIRTYIDWQLDKNTDAPETQVDPMTHILELLSSMGPDEHLWLQIIVRTNKKDEWYGFFGKDSFGDAAKEEIQKIIKGAAERAKKLAGEDKQAQAQALARGASQLSPIERLKIEAIERNQTKAMFECGIRGLYIAKKEAYNGTRIGDLVNIFKPFGYPGFNSMGPTRGLAIFNFFWQDWNDIRQNLMERKLFFWYKFRAFFFVPLEQDSTRMSIEELASLWHFPSAAIKTPGLSRVPSRVSEAPVNLPTAAPTTPPR